MLCLCWNVRLTFQQRHSIKILLVHMHFYNQSNLGTLYKMFIYAGILLQIPQNLVWTITTSQHKNTVEYSISLPRLYISHRQAKTRSPIDKKHMCEYMVLNQDLEIKTYLSFMILRHGSACGPMYWHGTKHRISCDIHIVVYGLVLLWLYYQYLWPLLLINLLTLQIL